MDYQPADRPGDFRGSIIDYGLFEASSGAIAINISAQLSSHWDTESQSWDDGWAEYNQVAYGAVWIVKKDGQLNQRQVEAVCKYAGWDGKLSSIADKTWEPSDCAFNVKEDEYEGKTTFKIAFVNGYDSTPGGLGSIPSDKLKELETRFGSSLRAIAGGAKSAAPNGDRPKKPAKPKSSAKRQTVPAGAEEEGDDLPF